LFELSSHFFSLFLKGFFVYFGNVARDFLFQMVPLPFGRFLSNPPPLFFLPSHSSAHPACRCGSDVNFLDTLRPREYFFSFLSAVFPLPPFDRFFHPLRRARLTARFESGEQSPCSIWSPFYERLAPGGITNSVWCSFAFFLIPFFFPFLYPRVRFCFADREGCVLLVNSLFSSFFLLKRIFSPFPSLCCFFPPPTHFFQRILPISSPPL